MRLLLDKLAAFLLSVLLLSGTFAATAAAAAHSETAG